MITSKEKLDKGIKALGVSFDSDKGLRYLAFLQKWNQSFNLTAITDLDEMVIKHLLDCLAIIPYIKGKRLLDVGSGAGFPGLVIALSLKELDVHLLDSSLKRCRFLEQAALHLGLDNVTVIHQRIEKFRPNQPFDVITSRAFSHLGQFIESSYHLKSTDGLLLAMKAKLDNDEKSVLKPLSFDEISLTVPFLKGQRQLIRIR